MLSLTPSGRLDAEIPMWLTAYAIALPRCRYKLAYGELVNKGRYGARCYVQRHVRTGLLPRLTSPNADQNARWHIAQYGL